MTKEVNTAMLDYYLDCGGDDGDEPEMSAEELSQTLLDAVVGMAWDAATLAREDKTVEVELLLEELERVLAKALGLSPFRE